MGKDDRTNPHPLYWVDRDREYGDIGVKITIGVRSTDSLGELSGAIATRYERALEVANVLTWRHADAIRREGFLPLNAFAPSAPTSRGDKALSDEERYILAAAADVLEGKAPGGPSGE